MSNQESTGEQPVDPLAEMSDESLVANTAVLLRELIRRCTRHKVEEVEIPARQVRLPLPFSRADSADYLRIVQLWTRYRHDVPIDAPPRPCPACRSERSRFQFFSYDQYPYHECRECGTWFVPQLIDGRVIDQFFSASPEAKRIAGEMMAEREDATRASDHQRFEHYFRLMRPLIERRSERVRYLDIGCGVGHSIDLATSLGWDALGVELSEVAVAVAQARMRNVIRPAEHDRAGQYHVVSLFETLEHVTDPDVVLSDAARMLAPQGVLIVTVPNRASLEISALRERCFHVFGGSDGVGHINLFDAVGLETLLGRHGLSLMFTDGQFGNDALRIFSHLVSGEGPVPDEQDGYQVDVMIPEPAYTLLNNVGPALSGLDRATRRSPILIGIACRTADRPVLASAFEAIQQEWRQEMLRLLETF